MRAVLRGGRLQVMETLRFIRAIPALIRDAVATIRSLEGLR